MKPGLYHLPITRALKKRLGQLSGLSARIKELKGSNHEFKRLLARVVADEIEGWLKTANPEECAQKINELLNAMAGFGLDSVTEAQIELPPSILRKIERPGQHLARPLSPITVASLSTGSELQPKLVEELRAEMLSADRIDLLVSFIKEAGWQQLASTFRDLNDRQIPIRVLTTTYTGATDASALVKLAELANVQVRIIFETRVTRVHAKAWIFARDSGFSTAFIGSANMSQPALTSGVEWNVKIAEFEDPHILRQCSAAFETLWQSAEAEPFDPADSAQRERLREAIAVERGQRAGDRRVTIFDLRPYPFQEQVLATLQEARTAGRTKNLIVAATGTGKTVIAAVDYTRAAAQLRRRPSLLFLAHRRELLQAALDTFRQALHDGNFGELLTGVDRPRNLSHLFATIASVRSQKLPEQLGSSYWEHVIVDEAHHAGALGYEDLLARLQPRDLLGLTATPERSDHKDIRQWFGETTAELRLWDALEKQVIAPFDYFGIGEDLDLSDVSIQRGEYKTSELEAKLARESRAQSVLFELQSRTSLDGMRALGFCVSVRHAQQMAEFFNRNGIEAAAVSGESSQEDRERILTSLQNGQLQAVFTCDLYNEGIDVPEANVALFLRPTASLTIFLQQLGRVLRWGPGKRALVLDFVGQHRQEFHLEAPFAGLLNRGLGELKKKLSKDTVFGLAGGSVVNLDKKAQAQILRAVERATHSWRRSALVRQLQRFELAEFLQRVGMSPAEFYGKGFSLAELWEASQGRALAGPARAIAGRLGRLLHINDCARLEGYRKAASGADAPASAMSMLAALLTKNAGLDGVHASEVVRSEILQLLDLLESTAHSHPPNSKTPVSWPLRRYGCYLRDELMAAVGMANRTNFEGLIRDQQSKQEIFLVTLNKEEGYAPEVRYKDYAINSKLFHWQSQNSAGPNTPAGARYADRNTDWTFQLMLRQNPGEAFTLVGPVTMEEHSGEKPMNVIWRLEHEMPSWLAERFSAI